MSFLAWRRRARAIGARIAALDEDERSAALSLATTTLIDVSLGGEGADCVRDRSLFAQWLDEQLRAGDVRAELRALAEQHGSRDAAPFVFEHLEHGIDPRSRVLANRYATPSPVAEWMARAALDRIQRHFDDRALDRWLALDPACGTGALLIALARQQPSLAHALHGIERDPIVAQSARTYLRTASVEVGDALRGPWARPTSGDSLIILGNPPYATDEPMSEHLAALVHGRDARSPASYRARKGERAVRNSKWLDTAQLRFLRWIHGECDRSRRAVAVIALGHAWVEHPTFVTVRRALCESFAEVSVLDLHGAARHGLHTPDGGRDQNVFDIQQGLALLVLVKREPERGRTPVFRRADLWGTRAHKLSALEADAVAWRATSPSAPDYRFEPIEERSTVTVEDPIESQWATMTSLSEVFVEGAPAIITGRDALALAFDRAGCERTIAWLADEAVSDEAVLARWGRAKDGAVREARERARAKALRIARWTYRPWDERFAIDDGSIVDRARNGSAMDALRTEKTLAIVTRRQSPPERSWNYVLLVDRPVCDGVLRADPHGTEVIFTRERLDRDRGLLENGRPAWRAALASSVCAEGDVPWERAFAYVVGLLCDRAFRERFQGPLCRETPRVSLPDGARALDAIADRGAEIIARHTAPIAASEAIALRGARSGVIERVRWSASESKLSLSGGSWIEGVTEADVQWTIGARRPALRWLEDREGERIDDALIKQYARVLARVRAGR
ncbi:MAG: type ISP restriction/modification enzyme [Polyangiales bacterium]